MARLHASYWSKAGEAGPKQTFPWLRGIDELKDMDIAGFMVPGRAAQGDSCRAPLYPLQIGQLP